ncbi:MAG: alginate export family protein [Acidobacteria bacterium]|nr:alginate export family protein [Acidobacteriota bacterium]
MKYAVARFAVWLLGTGLVYGQQVEAQNPPESPSVEAAGLAGGAGTHPAPASPAPAARAAEPDKLKAGRFELSINWRTRTEGWDWFQGTAGNNEYPFFDSLLRVGIGQTRERLDWFVEAETASILGLPANAVAALPQGQLGIGGSYYAANHNHTNNSSGFLKQAYLDLKHLGPANVKLGRFEFFDGAEVKPEDPWLATIVQTRISSRLISNFAYTAVQRSFDGGEFMWNSGSNNLTFFGARPTQGVFQVDGMDELDAQIYYGSFNHRVRSAHGAGALRVFALGYVDDRNNVLKTDDRPASARTADHGKIAIATYGANYVHVLKTENAGKFDLIAWGALQGGSWGALTQRAGAFVTEAGWQPAVKALKPWISLGYSYGSGDGNPNDGTNGGFFQVLPTPRQYARFPFYNMMNNEDAYATVNLKPGSRLGLRSEAHAMRLASAADLWYLGGGAFQPNTFGYTGRPGGGHRSLANVWDLSADYQVTRYFSTTVYYGHAWGRSVIEHLYPRNPNGQLAFLETNFHF